jgi:hypothetical protein
MTIRPIVRYPDPRLAPPAQPVTEFDGALRALATDLLETMHAATSASSSTPSTTPSASTPPSATARLLSSRQTSRYPKPPDTTMINTLSQKLPCLTMGCSPICSISVTIDINRSIFGFGGDGLPSARRAEKDRQGGVPAMSLAAVTRLRNRRERPAFCVWLGRLSVAQPSKRPRR